MRKTIPLIIRDIGCCDYQTTWQDMMRFTQQRTDDTPDEIWLLQHPPVFTQGLAGKPEHLINVGDIPVIQTDRGGQVTYHGPGQLVVYVLLDLKRLNIGIRQMVRLLEQSVIKMLANYHITAIGRCDAPGVYVQASRNSKMPDLAYDKICSIGLRVKKNCTYHGIALNVNMDLEPFARINPCGFKQLKMVQMRDFVATLKMNEVKRRLVTHMKESFGYCAEQITPCHGLHL